MTIVVPHAGTWIEMQEALIAKNRNLVVPHAGTWIEMSRMDRIDGPENRRSPRGNVD